MTTRAQVPPGRARRPALLLLALAFLLAAAPAYAQFVPYYGKNKVKYDNFNWRIYKSAHFEVFYYPEFEQHLARLTSYLETAYQKLSTGLKHEISHPIPAILYMTHSEFEETNLYPAFVPEQVLAFAEPFRGRLVLPIDEPPDKLQGLITHEMTHIFEFDIIPRGLFQRSIPLWIDEGLADYFRGVWDPLDLMMIRDAAITDQVPKLSRAEFEAFSGRLVYNMGHAAFEFMEARYGKEGIRQFLYTLRKGVLGGSTEDIYKQAFRTTPEEFDEAFDKWLKERFKPFRDKERPSDYGKDLSPNQEKTNYTQVFAFAPSPSGEMIAALTANRAEGEADLVLLSARDGTVLNNLTKGFTGEYEHVTFNDDFVAGRTIAFSPNGDSVALFARVNKRRSLLLISVLDGKILRKVTMTLDQAQGPCVLPDGRHVIFAAIKEGVSDLFMLDLETGATTNLTNDAFYDSNPQVSPDGNLVVYTRRTSGHDKIYVFPLGNPDRKTQLTFGAYDDATPAFSTDGNVLYYSSDEDDEIPNIRSLDLRTGVIKQYTDVLGGNMAPAALKNRSGDRVAFITYYKGEFLLHRKDMTEPLREIEQDVRVASEGMVDFQPDVVHQVIPENKRRKKIFEGLYLESRPPLVAGVTSGGNFFGGTEIALADILGDQQFLLTVYSVSGFRTYQGTYTNLAKRLHYGISGFDTTNFFYTYGGVVSGADYYTEGPIATQRYSGGQFIATYPLNKFQRIDMSAGVVYLKEQFENSEAGQAASALGQQQGIVVGLRNGWLVPLNVAFVGETTRFANFGPLDGSTYSVGFGYSPNFGSLSRYTVEVDARKYFRLGSSTALFAVRGRGFYSGGNDPAIFYFGGNSEMRGYPYQSFAGSQGFFANVELRLPIINLMATPIGTMGPLRAVGFFDIGAAHFKGQPYTFASSDPGRSYVQDPIFGTPVDGFHLVDGRASFGFGLEMSILGYPLHFDWSKLTDLKETTSGWRFDFWIGYNF